MAAEEQAIPITLQKTKIGRIGNSPATRKLNAPTIAIREAAFDVGHPRRSTRETTHGDSKSPRLPPPATSALGSSPALNQRTAIKSRKVVPALSRIPELAARH